MTTDVYPHVSTDRQEVDSQRHRILEDANARG